MIIDKKLLQRVGIINILGFFSLYIASFYPFDDLISRNRIHFGSDFLCFYTAGYFALNNVTSLYSIVDFTQFARELFPSITEGIVLPFRYPPHIALLFSGFSQLPYAYAVICYFAISLMCLVSGALLVITAAKIPNNLKQSEVLLFFLGAPVVLEGLLIGQLTSLIVLFTGISVYFFSHRRYLLAGFFLGLLLIKPNLLLPFVFGCIVIAPQTLITITASYVLTMLCANSFLGLDPIIAYFQELFSLATTQWQIPAPKEKIQSLSAYLEFFISTAHAKLLLLGVGLCFTFVCAIKTRKYRNHNNALGALLLLSVFCNGYLPIYDISLALLGLLMLSNNQQFSSCLRKYPTMRSMGVLLLYFGPHVSQYCFPLLGIQIFPILLIVFVFIFFTFANREKEISIDFLSGEKDI